MDTVTDEAAPPPKPPPSWRRRAVAAAIPAALVAALIAAHRPLLGFAARRKAAALGVDLDFDSIEIARGAVRIQGVRAAPSGVHGVRLSARAARVGTSFLSVTSVDMEGAALDIEGSAAARVLELAAWSSEHADAYRVRAAASEVSVSVRGHAGIAPWLTLRGGYFTSDGQSARFTAAEGAALGVPLGQVSAGFTVDATGLALDLGKGLVTARLRTDARPPALDISLKPIEIGTLGGALGLKLPAARATAAGSAALTLGKGGLGGTVAIDLDGWVPPHPRALDGIVTGHKTAVHARVALAEDLNSAKLSEVSVRAGKLDLKGAGSVAPEGDHAVVKLDLSGPIACADLARAVTKDELGGALGAIAGDLAGRAVGGSAVVNVSVEADTRDLGAAKVRPKVGVGCELKLPGL
jgi:hypothetical protein